MRRRGQGLKVMCHPAGWKALNEKQFRTKFWASGVWLNLANVINISPSVLHLISDFFMQLYSGPEAQLVERWNLDSVWWEQSRSEKSGVRGTTGTRCL